MPANRPVAACTLTVSCAVAEHEQAAVRGRDEPVSAPQEAGELGEGDLEERIDGLHRADARGNVEDVAQVLALAIDPLERTEVLQRRVDEDHEPLRAVRLVVVALDVELGQELARGLLGRIARDEEHLTDLVERANRARHGLTRALAQVVVEQH